MDNPILAAEPDATLPFKLTPTAVSEWVEGLPILNTAQTAEKLYRTLRALSNIAIEPSLRLQILDRLKETTHLLSGALEKYFLDATFPLPKSALKLSKLSSHLHRELSSGYASISKEAAFLDPKQFSTAQQVSTLKEAFFSLSQEQLLIAQRYEASSSRLWKQLYELIALTEQLDLLSGETPLTPIINRTLLFSLSNPNRFSQREIKALYNLLEQQAELAQLNDQPIDSQSKKAGFFVKLDLPHQPQHISRLSSDSSGSTVRYIHTHHLVEHLIDQFKTLISDEQESCLLSNRRMLGKIVRSLGAPERRKRQRGKSESPECTVISGLENIINFLSSPKEADVDNKTKAIKPARKASELWNDIPDFGIMPLDENCLHASHFRNNQRDENIANTKLIDSKGRITRSEIWGKPPHPIGQGQARAKPLSCKILDVSTKGFHLLWTTEDNANIKVSEIISISQTDQPMKTGVIRWIEQDSDAGLSFGIELLSPVIQLVSASSPKQPDSEIKGILIPELPEANIQQSLLVSPSKYRTGGWIDLKSKTVTRRYRLQKLLETSPSFNHFTLFKLDKNE